MIDTISAVSNPYRERKTLYMVADELGLTYRKIQCSKCAKDLYNIIREELCMIGSAADESDFNEVQTDYEYEYLPSSAVAWNGHIMNQSTPKEIVEEFYRLTGNRYYRRKKLEKTEYTNNKD